MKKLLLFTCSLIMAAAVEAQIIRVPDDYPTIQQGIDAANNGDTVLVSEGTYYEQVNFLGKKPLMVASEFLMDGDTSHIANTIIDGSLLTNPDSASVVYFISGEDTTSVLCGFTIQHGKGTSWFWQDYENLGGGGIYAAQSTAKISHNIIRDNELDDTERPDFSGCCGGGIHVSYGFPRTVVIEENKIFSNAIITNHLWTEGGGIYVYGAHSIIRNNMVTDNTSTNTNDTTEWAHGSAAGIICEANTAMVMATVTGNLIQGNIATGAWIGYGGGLDLWMLAEGSLIKNNLLINNSNNWLGGGMDLLSNDPNVRVEGNYFMGNSAAYGGAIDSWDYGSDHLLVNNVFLSNVATEEGGAIWIRLEEGNTGYYASVINNTFSGNHAGARGGAIYSYDYNPVIVNSIFWENTAPDGMEVVADLGNVEVAYSDLDVEKIAGEKIVGAGMLNTDPLFDDLSLLTLTPLSPCINVGTAEYASNGGFVIQAPAEDIMGFPRPVGAGYDMGAYESGSAGVPEIAADWSRHGCFNYPNPFFDKTTIVYKLEESSLVEIQVCNSQGKTVKTICPGVQEAGNHAVLFIADRLPSGVYYYFVKAGGDIKKGTMVLLK